MLHRLFAILPAACFVTSMASAQSPFMGTWKLDPSRSRFPDEMKVESKGGNAYTFDFGGGVETIVADGTDQPGVDSTLLSVKSAGADTWIVTRKQGGRVMVTGTWQLSNHDSTLTDAFREIQADGSTLSMDYIYQRHGAGSGIAADWQSTKETMTSQFVLNVHAFQTGGFSFASPMGTTSVTFDTTASGTGSSKSLRQVNDRTLLITFKQGATETAHEEFALSSDLKTLTMTVHIAGHAKPNVLVFQRQNHPNG